MVFRFGAERAIEWAKEAFENINKKSKKILRLHFIFAVSALKRAF